MPAVARLGLLEKEKNLPGGNFALPGVPPPLLQNLSSAPQCLRPAAQVQQNTKPKQESVSRYPFQIVVLTNHCAIRRQQVGDTTVALGLDWVVEATYLLRHKLSCGPLRRNGTQMTRTGLIYTVKISPICVICVPSRVVPAFIYMKTSPLREHTVL